MRKLSTIKNLLVLAVVALPLFVLMLKNLRQSMGTSEATALITEEKHSNYGELIERTKDRVEAEQPGVEKLSSADLFGEPPLPDLKIPGLDDAAWPRVKKARDTVDLFAKIYKHEPLEPETEKQQLEPFSSPERWEGLHETQPLQEWIAARLEKLTVLIQNKELLEEARQALKDKKYATYLANLEKLNREALTQKQSKNVDTWTKQAKFEEHWKPYRPDKNLAVRAKELEAKISKSPAPYDAESEARFAEKKQELNTIKVEMRRLALFKAPPALDELLEQCQALTTDDPTILQKLRGDFRDWLSTKILEKKSGVKDHAKLQEAWLINGTRKVGVFEKVGNGDIYNVYDLEDFLAKAVRGDRFNQIYRDQLKAEPRRLLEPRVVAQYNKSRLELIEKLDSKSAWSAFSTAAGKLQSQLSEYYDNENATEPEKRISFQDAIDFAQQIIQHWDGAGEFLATM